MSIGLNLFLFFEQPERSALAFSVSMDRQAMRTGKGPGSRSGGQ